MKKIFVLLFGLIIVIVIGGCQSLVDFFPFLNRAPIIISEPAITATEDQLYSYQVEASDPNGDTLTYSFIIKPEGMNIDSENGLITWTPTNDQVGINQVEVGISDGKQSVTQDFEVEVINVNNPPQILSYFPTNINIKINEGSSVKFEIQARDIDLNTILGYQWLLNGKKVSSSTVSGDGSKSSWTYSGSYGDYSQKIVKVVVSDGELENFIQWNIVINDTTAPAQPTLDSITSQTNISSQALSGTKEVSTSIWINGVEVVPLDSSVSWLYPYNLSEGTNNISITSRDTVGNESSEVTAIIEYDPNIYVDAANTTGVEDGTQTHPFNSIIEGIDAVAPGKSVIVDVGTYKEQLIIARSITLRGASRDNTFITGSGLTGNLITIEADYVTITGFTIDGTNSTAKGIYFDNCSSININNNTIQNNVSYGINYSNSSPTIECNDIKDNDYSAIDIAIGGAGTIKYNFLIDNRYGIRSCVDSSPEITRNNISNNNTGIYCRESATPIISYNTISNNTGYGILIDNLLVNSVNPDIGGGDGESDGQNKITGNLIHGVSNETTHKIYAKYNWWGDSAGPKYPYNPDGNAGLLSDWAYWDTTKKQGPIDFSSYLSVEP